MTTLTSTSSKPMKKFLKDKLAYILVGSLFLALGFIIAKAIQFPYFEVDKSINVVDLSALVLTIFLAIYIPFHLDRKNSANRTEKDLILKKVEDVIELNDRLNEDLNQESIALFTITSRLKAIHRSTSSVFDLITKCSIGIPSDRKASFTNYHKEIREVLTKTPIDDPNAPEPQRETTKVIDGNVYYPSSIKAQAEGIVGQIKDCLFQIQIDVNRS